MPSIYIKDNRIYYQAFSNIYYRTIYIMKTTNKLYSVQIHFDRYNFTVVIFRRKAFTLLTLLHYFLYPREK